MALLIVSGGRRAGCGAVRPARDFGSTDAPAAAAEPRPLPAPADAATAAPGHARPAGSRTKKPATNGRDAGPAAL